MFYNVKMLHFVQHDSEKTIDNYIIINNATVKKIFLS